MKGKIHDVNDTLRYDKSQNRCRDKFISPQKRICKSLHIEIFRRIISARLRHCVGSQCWQPPLSTYFLNCTDDSLVYLASANKHIRPTPNHSLLCQTHPAHAKSQLTVSNTFVAAESSSFLWATFLSFFFNFNKAFSLSLFIAWLTNAMKLWRLVRWLKTTYSFSFSFTTRKNHTFFRGNL